MSAEEEKMKGLSKNMLRGLEQAIVMLSDRGASVALSFPIVDKITFALAAHALCYLAGHGKERVLCLATTAIAAEQIFTAFQNTIRTSDIMCELYTGTTGPSVRTQIVISTTSDSINFETKLFINMTRLVFVEDVHNDLARFSSIRRRLPNATLLCLCQRIIEPGTRNLEELCERSLDISNVCATKETKPEQQEKSKYYGNFAAASSAARAQCIHTQKQYKEHHLKNSRLPPDPEKTYINVWAKNGGWEGFLQPLHMRRRITAIRLAQLNAKGDVFIASISGQLSEAPEGNSSGTKGKF
ncbi:MAG: hypothetical protein ABIH21_03095 [Patescibacteria group bacterium]